MTKPARRQIDTWQKAEQNAAQWMTYYGYQGVRLTPAGADGGIDVTANGAAAQVKYASQDIGRPQLQRLVGARNPGSSIELLFSTGSRYSKTAIEYANSWRIGLFRYELNGAVSPVNEAARGIASRAEYASAPRRPPPRTRPDVLSRTAHSPWSPTAAATNAKSVAAKLKDAYRNTKETRKGAVPSQSDEEWRASLRAARTRSTADAGRRRGGRKRRPETVEQRKATAGCLAIIAIVLFVLFAAGLALNPDNRSGSALAAGLTFIFAPALLCTAIVWLKRRRQPPNR